MTQQAQARLGRLRRLAARQLAVLLCALALGCGVSLWRSEQYLPTIGGNVSSILVDDAALFMVLANGDSTCLVRTDWEGRLLNYAQAGFGQTLQYLEAAGDTIYAILSGEISGKACQTLAAFSLNRTAMKGKTLTRLTGLGGAPDDVVWRELYLPPKGTQAPVFRLVGVDSRNQGWLLSWDADTGHACAQRILEGEELLYVKYVEEGRYVWIDRERRAGQWVNGVWQRDILSGLAETPLHISACGARCFLSDSVGGNIYEVMPDGAAVLYRDGADEIGSTGLPYRRLEIYTTWQDSSQVRVVGLCAEGAGRVIAGEGWYIRALDLGGARVGMILRRAIPATALFWFVIAVLTAAARCAAGSPRLAARLAVCEVLTAVLLLGSLTAVQYYFFIQTIVEDAQQKLSLVGGTLVMALDAGEPLEDGALALAVERTQAQASFAAADCTVAVALDSPDGPVVGYDGEIPAGYLLEDVKPRAYLTLVSDILRRGGSTQTLLSHGLGADYIYVQQFTWGGRTGCVTVSRPLSAMLAESGSFLRRLIPVLAACPPLFLALILITRQLLRPLDEIRRAMEEFYLCGGGNQMVLAGMPRTELYEVGRVFNQLSLQTRTQFNELQTINDAYVRLTPGCLLEMLGSPNAAQLSAGDRAAVAGGMLLLVPKHFLPGPEGVDRLARIAADRVAAHGGMLVDYDESLHALTALFPAVRAADSCARDCLDSFEEAGQAVMSAVLEQTVELGVFGGQRLLYPLAVAEGMERRLKALGRLLEFGGVLVRAGGAPGPELRLLGWDGKMEFHEDPALRPADWQVGWRRASDLWRQSIDCFRQERFAQAARGFAGVLRLMPEDMAARWYLFRCKTLEEAGGPNPDTGLLFDWGAESRG